MSKFSKDNNSRYCTCVASAKRGLVEGQLRPPICPSVCPSVRASIRITNGCPVGIICNYNSFHSFLFKLCIMIVFILKMCTSFIVHISRHFPHFEGCLTQTFFLSKRLRWGLVCVICNSKSFHSFVFKLCMMIVHILETCASYFVHNSRIYFSLLRGVELRQFTVQNA